MAGVDKDFPNGSGITLVEAAGLYTNNFVFMGCSLAGASQKTLYSELAAAFGSSRRNLLINANPAVNQRGYVSGTATTTGNQYTLDRWRVITSGQALSFSDSEGKRTMTAPADGVEQVVDGAWLQSGTYVISWEGTAGCTVGGSTRTNGEAFSVTGGSNVAVVFGDGTIANPQFEPGEVPSVYDWRPDLVELPICRQFYQKLGTNLGASGYVIGFGSSVGATQGHIIANYQCPMRIAPQITINGGNVFSYSEYTSGGVNSLTSASISTAYISTINVLLVVTLASGGNAGAPVILYTTASGSNIELDAEIH